MPYKSEACRATRPRAKQSGNAAEANAKQSSPASTSRCIGCKCQQSVKFVLPDHSERKVGEALDDIAHIAVNGEIPGT